MKNVCFNCHNEAFVDNFYAQYDGLVQLYNDKFAQPGKELMELAQPLLKPVVFGNKIDFIWFAGLSSGIMRAAGRGMGFP
jgi:hypothetical protein